MTIIDESNLSRNVKRAFKQYFRNGMILGGVISPPSDGAGGSGLFAPHEQKRVEEQLVRDHRGVSNAHRWIISPRTLDIETFDLKKLKHQIKIQISRQVTNQFYVFYNLN